VQSYNFIAILVNDGLGISVGLGAVTLLVILVKDLLLQRSELDMVDVDVVFSVFLICCLFIHSTETVL